ncbi:EamA family transporter [Neobacillus dielmonensis]|uniref:EamA family transporter n=1 Tax=Neobacillus dielmonensis TaxID=1347369 RepID=UPI0005AB3BCF|nr:EamA family transporter [Neobacillus dielmonensis]
MWVAAAFVTMLCFGVNNIVFKWSTGKGFSKVHIQFFFYLAAFLLSISYGMMVGIARFSMVSVLLGAMIGILNANGNIQMSKAFENGPASLTSPLIGMNTIIPILSAALIFHEHISLIQWVGIMLMLGSAVMIQYSPSVAANTHYLPWLTRILLAIFSFGILGILMKTSSYLNINSLNTLISMYGGGTVYLAINSFVKREKWLGYEAKTGVMVGLISVIGYASYFFALNTGTASIVFPIVSLNCLVVVLGGCWLFKEKLKTYQMIGVLSALLGILFTKI